MRKGVAGFRVDAVPHLYESKENAEGYYDDEPLSGYCQEDPNEYCHLNHIHTHDLEETFGLIYQWRAVMDESEFINSTRLVINFDTFFN